MLLTVLLFVVTSPEMHLAENFCKHRFGGFFISWSSFFDWLRVDTKQHLFSNGTQLLVMLLSVAQLLDKKHNMVPGYWHFHFIYSLFETLIFIIILYISLIGFLFMKNNYWKAAHICMFNSSGDYFPLLNNNNADLCFLAVKSLCVSFPFQFHS